MPRKQMRRPEMPAEMEIQSIVFKRSKNSPEEAGIIINEGSADSPIIDMLGNVVPAPIWYWAPMHELYVMFRPPKREP